MPIVGSVLGALKRKKVRLQLSISMLFMILILPVLALIMFYSYRENSRNLISLANVQIERARDDSIAVATKGLSGNKRAIWGISLRRDSVVPLAVEFGAFDIDRGHLGVRDDNAAGVLASVEFAAHSKAGFGGGGRD